MSAIPRQRSTRNFHATALLAALAYGAAAFALYSIVTGVTGRGEESGVAGVEATSPLGADALTLRTVAARTRSSTYVVEGAGGAQGSASLGWVRERDGVSFLLTARAAVANALADDSREVYVRRGDEFWAARIVRQNEQWGLAVLRVDVLLDRPLWQRPAQDRGSLARDVPAVVVPAGSVGLGEGLLANEAGEATRWLLATPGDQAYLGAPVLVDDGRVAGVVVELQGDGLSRIVPVAAACRGLRNC